MKEKQTDFVESSGSNIKKLVANAVPERTKEAKNMLSTSLKVKKVTSRVSNLVLHKLKLSHFIKQIINTLCLLTTK